MSSRTQHTHFNRSMLTAGIVALVLLLSAVIVALVLTRVTDSSVTVIELTPPSAQSAEAVASGASAQAEEATSTRTETSDTVAGVVTDKNSHTWTTTSTSVELFHSAYLSPDGTQVTVQSANGDHVIAPGTDASYDFTVRNPVDATAVYTLAMTALLDLGNLEAPLEARVWSSDGWLVGGQDTWVPLSEIALLDESASLPGHSSRDYRLDWRWIFDGDDEADTTMGNRESQTKLTDEVNDLQDANAYVELRITSTFDDTVTTSPGDASQDASEDSRSAVSDIESSEGPDADALRMILLAYICTFSLFAILVLLAALIARRIRERKRDQSDEDSDDDPDGGANARLTYYPDGYLGAGMGDQSAANAPASPTDPAAGAPADLADPAAGTPAEPSEAPDDHPNEGGR